MKNLNVKRFLVPSIATIILLSFPISITSIFINAQNKIQKQVLKNNMTRLDEISNKIIKMVRLEIRYSVHLLKTIVELSDIDVENLSFRENFDILQKIDNKGHFEALGLLNLKGEVIETYGYQKEVNRDEVYKAIEIIKRDGYYVSDVVTGNSKEISQDIMIAIPLYNDKNEISGVIFGNYPIIKIAEDVILSENTHQYFQILDTKGKYISRSNSINSLVISGESLWDEIKRYNFSDGESAEKIKKSVENRQSGSFYFETKTEGRYVTYKPLEINNWYIFSVITREEINFRINRIQKISENLLFYLTIINIFLVIFVIGISRYLYLILKKQNQKIEIKNKMFKLLTYKTKDIIFEVQTKENKFIFYKTSENESEEFYFSLEEMNPKTLITKGYLKIETLPLYENLYKNILSGKSIEGFSVELKVEGEWKWFNVHSITTDPENIVGILEDFTENKEQEIELSRINEKSKYDFLTGLYNRETFEKEFSNFLERNKNHKGVSTLFLMDLDNFKNINDIFGHDVGDSILRETAKVLKSNLRKEDFAGRLGGDEFIILIENAENIDVIHKIAKRLNSSLTKTYIKEEDSIRITVTASIGVTPIKDNSSFETVYKEADKALYQVKYNGRNSYFINK